jgi:hypothetical protein
MKFARFLIVALLIGQAGCTAQALRRRTVLQAETWTELPYRQVLENLAMVANRPDVLPSYSVIDAGTTSVNDTVGVNGVLNILPTGATNGSFDPNVKRSINGNWVLTQVTGPEKLRALHLAFQYGIYCDHNLLTVHDHRVTLDAFCYPRHPCLHNPGEQASATQLDADGTSNCIVSPTVDGTIRCDHWCPGEPGYYFSVRHELEAIPPGWLHIGKKKQVPKCARLVASCGDTYVWVNEDGMDGLSQFTLAIQRIARTPTEMTYAPTPALLAITDQDVLDKTRANTIINCDGGDDVKVSQVQLPIDCYGHVIISKFRGDAIQTTDSKLKSALTGVIKTQ